MPAQEGRGVEKIKKRNENTNCEYAISVKYSTSNKSMTTTELQTEERTPTTLVMVIEHTNAANGLVNPGVAKNVCTDSKNGGSFSFRFNFSNSDEDGGVGGKF